MKAFVKAVVLGLLLVGLSDVGWALPKRAKPGQVWCECDCKANDSGYFKTLSFESTTGTCGVGKDCKYTFDGGKTWTEGKRIACDECTGTLLGTWNCKRTLSSSMRFPSDTFQLQPATPKPQPPAATTPPSVIAPQ
jgi:hypothetical protein